VQLAPAAVGPSLAVLSSAMLDVRRRVLLLLAAGAHLAIVEANAAGVRFPGRPLGRAIAEYAAISGAEARYAFFVPSVDAELRTTFDIVGRSGRETALGALPPVNDEVDLRVGNLRTLYWTDDEEFEDALLGAWVASILQRHPEAERVELRVDFLDLPSMREYREGERPAWISFGTTSYGCDGSPEP
jgi:hypothetical protein